MKLEKVLGVNIIRRANKFEHLPIIPMFSNNNTRYFIFDKKNTMIGAFNFTLDGQLSDVKLADNIKRTKKGAAALLSIRDFIIEKIHKNKIKEISFAIPATPTDNAHLRRLCSKFNVTEKSLFNGLLRYVGVLNQKSEIEAMGRTSAKFTANT